MNKPRAARALANALHALEQELLAASDEEVLEAATALGLKPDMKGSIALAGVTLLVLRKAGTEQIPALKAKPSRRRAAATRPRKD